MDKVPESVVEVIQRGVRGEIPENPVEGDAIFNGIQNVIVASNDLAAEAAQRQADALGLNTLLLSTYVEGEAREVARVLAAIAKEIRGAGRPVLCQPA